MNRYNITSKPVRTVEVAELARKHTSAALLTLADIMADTAAPPAARVAAANAILDRGHGRPKQSVETQHVDLTQLHLAALREHLAGPGLSVSVRPEIEGPGSNNGVNPWLKR